MTTAYEKLKNYVDTDQLNITFIDAPPRTISSALLRSLTPVHDGSLYEPFVNVAVSKEKSFEAVYQKILDEAIDKGVEKHKVNIIIKDIANRFSDDKWQELMPVVKKFVAIIRDPHLQIHSLMTRIANDIAGDEKGASILNEKEVWELSEDVSSLLSKGHQTKEYSFAGNFRRVGWERLNSHYEAISSHLEQHPEKTFAVIPSFLLRADPENTMSSILENLEIGNNSKNLEKTLNWDKKSFEPIKERFAATPGYTKDVHNSTGFLPPLNETFSLERFPSSMQQYLLETAIPAYINLLNSPVVVGSRKPSELETIFTQEFNNAVVSNKNPISAYAIISTVPTKNLSLEEIGIRKNIITDLRNKHPEHIKAMDKIDALITNKTMESIQNDAKNLSLPNTPKAVLFDWDNTIIDSHFTDEVISTITKQRKEPALTLKQFLDATTINSDNKNARRKNFINKILDVYKNPNAYENKPELLEGAKENIQKLLDKNTPVAIVSNSPQEIMDVAVPIMLGDEIAKKLVIVGRKEGEIGKPSTDTTSRAIRELNTQGSNLHINDSSIYMVGDSIDNDVTAAKAASFTPILFGADHMGMLKTVENHKELGALL